MKQLIVILFLFNACQNNVNMDINEWIDTTRYANDNQKLRAKKNLDQLTVFIGDSITEGWDRHKPDFFSNPKLVNRGISGQTSHQMLLRFRQDVINLNPEMVIINCGTNDIAGNAGTYTLDDTMGNIKSMCDLAKANNIKVVLSAVLPSDDFGFLNNENPAENILALNNEIKKYATETEAVYLDYHTAMKTSTNALITEYTYDGLHPNAEGYKIMEEIIELVLKLNH